MKWFYCIEIEYEPNVELTSYTPQLKTMAKHSTCLFVRIERQSQMKLE